jgi:indolepyruvate ferredoxin oxidoreductase alpha subunit
VAIENRNQQNEIQIPENLKQFVLLPAFARKNYNRLIEIQSSFQYESLNSGFNTYFEGTNKNLGIIVSGIAYNYLLENIGSAKSDYPILKITQYPLPSELIKKIYDDCKSLLVIEEGYPFIEESISGILSNGKQIKGRLDGTLPRVGELEPSLVAKALNLEIPVGFAIPEIVVSRPPSLCGGCPHIDSFNALNEALQDFTPGRVFSDIGCYALGALPPFDLINSCVDMGASVTMAKGASDAGLVPSVAVIGDSTFTHSGITGLIDAVQDKTPITVIILDNLTTAMTGGQLSQATGRIEEICKGIGVEEEHIRIFTPLKKNHSENVKVIREEMNYKGVSVIIPRRECVVTITKKTKEARAAKSKTEDKE